MKTKITLILFLIIKLNLLAQEDVWYARAEKAFRNNNLPEAISSFSKVIEINNKNKHAFYNRGLCYLYQFELEKAIFDFTEVINLDPKNADAFNNRGLSFIYIGLPDSALKDLNQAISLDNNFIEAYINRATALIELQNYDQAIKDLSFAIKNDPKNPSPFNEQGRIYYKKKEYKKAITSFSKAIELGMKSPVVYYNRGNAYFRNRQFKKAIDDYSIVLKSDTTNLEALNNRALAYDSLGMKDLADKDRLILKERRQTDPDFPPIEKIVFQKFSDSLENISIEMPENWFFFTESDSNSITVVLSKDKIQSINEPFLTGVRLTIDKNMKSRFDVTGDDNLLEFWKGSTIKNSVDYHFYDIISQKLFNRFGYRGLMNTSTLQITENSPKISLYEYVLVHDDNIFYAYFQCPEIQFRYYKDLFDRAIESLNVKL
jgi:tetratricopeptide (TPR) repeat protein